MVLFSNISKWFPCVRSNISKWFPTKNARVIILYYYYILYYSHCHFRYLAQQLFFGQIYQIMITFYVLENFTKLQQLLFCWTNFMKLEQLYLWPNPIFLHSEIFLNDILTKKIFFGYPNQTWILHYSFLAYHNLILTLTGTFLTLAGKQSEKNGVGPY